MLWFENDEYEFARMDILFAPDAWSVGHDPQERFGLFMNNGKSCMRLMWHHREAAKPSIVFTMVEMPDGEWVLNEYDTERMTEGANIHFAQRQTHEHQEVIDQNDPRFAQIMAMIQGQGGPPPGPGGTDGNDHAGGMYL